MRAAALAGLLALVGCSVPKAVNPVLIYNRVSGRDDAQRLPPPGMDAPSPNLGAIPPKPERPPPGATDAISAALIEDRLRAATAQPDRARAAALPAFAPGNPPIPAGPPPPPALATVPIVAADRPAVPPIRPAGLPAAPVPAPASVPANPPLPAPGVVPPPPPSELLGLPR